MALGAAAVAGLKLNAGTPPNVTLAKTSGKDLAADQSILLVDIRTPEEWKQTGVVEGAHLITYAGPDAFLSAVKPLLKDGQKIGLICRSGNRTSRASAQIAAKTEAEIVDIAGGMLRVLGEGYRPVAPTRAMGCASC